MVYDPLTLNYMFGEAEQSNTNWIYSSIRSQSVVARAYDVDLALTSIIAGSILAPVIQDLSLDNWVTDVQTAL